jgi:hypothetical protein
MNKKRAGHVGGAPSKCPDVIQWNIRRAYFIGEKNKIPAPQCLKKFDPYEVTNCYEIAIILFLGLDAHVDRFALRSGCGHRFGKPK